LRRSIAAILIAALAIRIAVALAMPNELWPDEIFQSLEQAHRVVFGHGVIPWEFRDATRSWLLPGVLAGVMAGAATLGLSYLTACAAVLSAISLAPVWSAFRSAATARGAVVAAGTVALWYELVYFAPKALAEVVAGNVLAAGVALAGVREPRARESVATAALLALAMMLRIQLAPAACMCLTVALWRARVRWQPVVAAAAVVLAVGLLDAVTWSYPFQSFVENVRANVLRSASYGTAPWYAYVAAYAHLWGPAGLVVVGLAAAGARRAPLAGVAVLVIIATHIAIPHKEYRFLYPALVLVLVLAGVGLADLVDRVRDARHANLAAAGALAFVLALSLSLANRFDDPLADFGLGPKGHPISLWTSHRGLLAATRAVGEDPDVCGVALAGLHWSQTGGYTYLHRDVPLLDAMDPARLPPLAPFANALIARSDLPPQIGPYVRTQCWPLACVYRRAGGCAPLTAAAEAARAGRD
jgi:hypothetical protein